MTGIVYIKARKGRLISVEMWGGETMSSYFVIISLVALLAFSLPGQSKQAKKSPLPFELKQQMMAVWDGAHFLSKEVRIWYSVRSNGDICNVRVHQSCGYLQGDLSCLEAVCAVSPVVSSAPVSQMEETNEIVFPANSEMFWNGEDIEEYKKTHTADLKDRHFVFIHRIPLHLLKRYPGLFSEAELRRADNLLPLVVSPLDEQCDLDNDVDYKAIAFYEKWANFLKGGQVTRGSVLAYARRCDLELKQEVDR